jgi:hypothetical protein
MSFGDVWAHAARFGCPAPGAPWIGACSAAPADATIRQLSPATGMVSPGLTTRCLARAHSSAYAFHCRAVIDEPTDGDPLDELQKTADVIDVIMR